MNALETALRYHSVGLCVLPADAVEKRPALPTWKQYQLRLPSEAEVRAWFATDRQICILTGAVSGNLEMIDFDGAGEKFSWWRELVETRSPGLTERLLVERSPSGGWHVVYRCESEICGNIKLAERAVAVADDQEAEFYGKRYKPRRVNDRWEVVLTLIETRGEGGLFLCAPSPGYELVQGDYDQLSVLRDEERELLLEVAWSLNELHRAPEPEPVAATGNACDGRPGDDFNQRGDVRELLRKHGWTLVRAGENEYWRRPGKSDGWSATLKDRVFYVFTSNAAPFEPNRAYAPFSVFALLEHGGDFSAAAAALRVEGYGNASLTTPTVSIPIGWHTDTGDEPREPEPESPGRFPTELIDEAPPIVHRARAYYEQSAIEVQPPLFLASLIAATGTVLGHKVQDKSGLRTNVYTVGILPTGGGKEATREFVFKIFQHAGIEALCGQEEFASDAGLIAAVATQNPILFQIDEFGRFLHGIKAGANRNPHDYNIAGVLLKFYSKAGSVFRSRAYADTKRNISIAQPHVCVYGTTVRSNYWTALDKDSLDGGFLPRTLLFEATDDSTPGGETDCDPPADVIDFFRYCARRVVTSGNLESAYPHPTVIPFTAAAMEVMTALRAQQKALLRQFDGLGVLWSRARENAGKLAIIHACWKDQESPIVDVDSAEWAVRLVTHVVQHAVYEAYLCVAESPFHERCQRIMQFVQRAEARQVTRRMLTRATRGMTPRERDEAILALVEQGRLRSRRVETSGRPVCWYDVPDDLMSLCPAQSRIQSA